MSEKLMDRVSEIFDGIAASNESENPKTERRKKRKWKAGQEIFRPIMN